MALPNLPVQGQNPWFVPRNNWDIAVKSELEGRLSEVTLNNTLLRGLSVRAFGATGNGVTNDTAAIVAAESAAATLGASLWFPSGTYMTDGFQTRVSLRGDRAVVKLRATNARLLEITGSGVEIHNLVINGNNLATGSVIDVATNRTDFRLRDCEVSGVNGTGTVAILRLRGGTHRAVIDSNWIHGAVSTTVGRGILVSSADGLLSPMGIKIVGNTIEDIDPYMDADGICVQNFTSEVDVLISGNTFIRCRKRAIKIQCNGVIMDNNRIFTTYDAGQTAQCYSAISVYASNCSVTNNRISGVFATGAIDLGANLVPISDVYVVGNSILGDVANRQSSGDGVTVDATTPFVTRTHISQNVITGVRIGIRLQGTIDQTECVGNHFTSLSASAYIIDDNNSGPKAQVRIGGGSIKSVANYSVTTDGGTSPAVLIMEPIIGAGGFGIFGSNAAAGVRDAVNGVTPVARAAAIASPTAPGATYSQAEMASIKTAVDALRTANSSFGITSP